MLRIEIESAIEQLFDTQKEKRILAKTKLIEMEKDGEITIEILKHHLEGDNLIIKKYAIGALRRIGCKDQKKIFEKYFLENEDSFLFIEFVENFLKLQEISFEDCIIKKINLLDLNIKKEKDLAKKERLKKNREQSVLNVMSYLQNAGSFKCHSLCYELLASKNSSLKYHSLLTLLKTGANLTDNLLNKIKAKNKGLVFQLAQMILEQKK